MNKQIQEFMQQAGTDVSGKWMSVDNATKFAELIVGECIGVAIEQKKLAQQPVFNPQDITWDRARIQQSDLIIHKIKAHFGVEE